VVTDESGRFSFPQLRPGTYTVKVEAQGFAAQQIDSVASGLGQNQTANFKLAAAAARQSVMVTGEAPLINAANANTSTTMNAHALEDLPNPGGDLTYPLQFSPGALVNTAGSSNDFVGSSRLRKTAPALSNAMARFISRQGRNQVRLSVGRQTACYVIRHLSG